MSKLSEKLKEEVEAIIPPTLFFFVALHIVAIIRALMFKGTGIPLSTSASVTAAAIEAQAYCNAKFEIGARRVVEGIAGLAIIREDLH